MNQLTTKAIVLKRTNYQEADRILTLLTSDNGKIRVIAKGVRKMKSRLAAGLELLSVSDVTYIVGRSEIYTLVSSRIDQHFGDIVKDIDRTMLAYDLLKIVERLTEDHTGQEYFEVLQLSFEGLSDLSMPLGLVEIWFNLRILQETGHAPNFSTTEDGSTLQEGKLYAFDGDHMAFIESSSATHDKNVIKLLRFISTSPSLAQLKKLTNIEHSLDSSRKLSQSMMARYVRV